MSSAVAFALPDALFDLLAIVLIFFCSSLGLRRLGQKSLM
jgi:hypothetical protein